MAMPEFVFLDPDAVRRLPPRGLALAAPAPQPAAWKPWLGAQWRPVAAERRALNGGCVLDQADRTLGAVEAALAELATSREARLASSCLWCAARALDASVAVRTRFTCEPPRYRELVEQLELRLAPPVAERPSATEAAVHLRTASRALMTLAALRDPREPCGPRDPREPCGPGLRALDDGAVGLAALGVRHWLAGQRR